jgi:phosphatidate phosphatase LPIN
VSLDLLSLNKYKISYVSMREIVDHFFPPVSMLVKDGGEDFTDFNYWRDIPKGLDDFSATESESSSIAGDEEDEASAMEESVNDLAESYLSRESIDQSALSDSIRESMEALIGVAPEDLDGDLASDYLGDAGIAEPATAAGANERVVSPKDDRKQRRRSKT